MISDISAPILRARIKAVRSALPSQVIENASLFPGLPSDERVRLDRLVGVRQRHVAAPGETALDLGATACRRLFADHPGLEEKIDTLIFCTQMPDYVTPPNSCILHGVLGLPEFVFAFDISHACSGYVYALSLAQALMVSGMSKEILVVTADTYTRHVNEQDRSTRLLFGDGAAATWLSGDKEGFGVIETVCGTAGRYYDKIYIPASGFRCLPTEALRSQTAADSSGNVRSPCDLHMNGRDVLAFVASTVSRNVREVLDKANVGIDEIDWFIPHQASALIIDTFTRSLQIDAGKVVRNVERVGNTVSASIPIALSEALDEGKIRSGQLVILSGFGSGLSWGTMLLRW